MKIRMTIEVLANDSFGTSEEELLWLENEILVGNGNLILHSNEIGDEIGVIRSVQDIEFTKNDKES